MQFVITAIGWLMGKIVADNVLRFVATKLLMGTFFLIVLPLIFNNILYDLIGMFLDVASENVVDVGAFNGNMTFSGFGAWLISGFRLPECISVITSAMCLRAALNFIPFLRA